MTDLGLKNYVSLVNNFQMWKIMFAKCSGHSVCSEPTADKFSYFVVSYTVSGVFATLNILLCFPPT